MTAVKEARNPNRNTAVMKDAVAPERVGRSARVVGVCLGGLAVMAVAIAAMLASNATTARSSASNVTLVYVGASDCAPCRAWQNGDGAAFRRSADFAQLSYREVKAPHLAEVLNDEYWPEDLRAYRHRLKQSDGVPLWIVVSGDTIVMQRHGAAAWRNDVLPRLRRTLRYLRSATDSAA